jgi:HPr kinase/phosphorylase
MSKPDKTSSVGEENLNQKVVSGGMLQINGLGVLIKGDSGIGKSESALELISRGWRFVSDDVTNIKKISDNKLIGISPSLSRYFMEIRGLGIINIKQIFGSKAICKSSKIDLVINLKNWEQNKVYDRLGLESPEKYELLGVKIPQIIIPVAPGRNIATLIEVACKVQVLKEKGYHAPQEITYRLNRNIASKARKRNK